MVEDRVGSFRCEECRPLPPLGFAVNRAACLQRVVERCPAKPARAFTLPARPVHGIGKHQRLGTAFTQIGIACLEILDARRVHFGQVHCRMPGHDPFRKRLARTGAGLDAGGIDPGQNEISGEIWRRAKRETPVMGVAFRTVEECADAGALQDRNALHRQLQHLHDILLDERKAVEFERFGNAVRRPCLGMEMRKAEQQLSGILFPVGAVAIGPQHRQVRRQACNRFGDEIIVLAGMQRHADAVAPAQLARPHAAAIDHDIGLDYALAGAHTTHLSAFGQNLFDKSVFEQARTVHARALCQRLGKVAGVGGAVARHEDAAKHALGIHQGPALGNLRRLEERCLDSEQAGEVGLAPELGHTLVIQRDGDGTVLPKPRVLAGLGLDFLQQLDTIAGKRRGGVAALQLADKPGGMPGRAAGQLFPFQQHHIAPACLGKVIGDGTAMNAAADDNGLGAVGQGAGHQATPPSVCG